METTVVLSAGPTPQSGSLNHGEQHGPAGWLAGFVSVFIPRLDCTGWQVSRSGLETSINVFYASFRCQGFSDIKTKYKMHALC